MKNSFHLAIISFVLLFILTGCSSSFTSIDDYYFAIALGIDKASENNIKLSIQIPSDSNQEASSGSSSQSSSYQIYSVESHTIQICNIIVKWLSVQQVHMMF